MAVQRIKYAGIIHLMLVISILAFGISATPVSALDLFPTTPILDNFNRVNGAIGTNWSGFISAFSIASNQMDVVAGGFDTYTFWNGISFGADQEAYVTFSQVDADATEQSLLLKSQSNVSYGNGVIEVLYDANADVVQVWTFHPTGGWVQRGANIPVTFVNGDQFGAHALANGTVEVYKNDVLLGARSITGWALYASSGYIGMWFADATDARLDDFGGGSVSLTPTNTVTITPVNTLAATPTITLQPMQTSTPLTSTATLTPSLTPVNTFTSTSIMPTPTDTPIHLTETNTSIPPIATFTPITTATFTPLGTVTNTPISSVTIYRVATNGVSSPACGNSWANPCDLQYALTTLAASNSELWVKQGVYTPGNNRTSTFQLKSGVAVYGGFAGAETTRNQRNADPATNNTILSGDIGTVGAVADNVYSVVTVSGSLASAYVLDGFTITGGNSNGGVGHGGGIFIQDCSPTLANLIVSNNTASANGGGIYVVSLATVRVNYSSPMLTNVTITNNTAARGGGLYTQNGNPILINVTLSRNTATGGAGGGMNNQVLNESTNEYSIPLLTNVTFSGNNARGGAGLFNNHSYPVLINVTFSDNVASIRGGAILNEGASPVFRNVTFSGNTAPVGTGGAIRNIQNAVFAPSNPQIYNSILWGNGAEEITSDGTGTTIISDSVVQGGFAGGTNIITTDPLLGALANNGGFTQTRALGAGSSAIDVGGVNSTCAATDQRGITRPQGTRCDIGSYEAASSLIPTSTPSSTPTNTAIPTQTPIPPTATFTSVYTPTFTSTYTPTNVPTFTVTATSTNTPALLTATFTPTRTATYTPTNTATLTPIPGATDMLYLSSTTDGTTGGVTFSDEDILSYNRATSSWSMYFDGSDVGITSDVDAFFRMSDGTILLSLDIDGTVGSFGTVDDSDIIRFTPTSLGTNTAGSFSWYFDGSDVGLTTTAEDMDVIGFAPDGKLVISMLGSFSVTGVSGNDEDLISFAATSLGATTSGTWALYFDGSDVGLNETTSEQINGIWIDPATNRIYLTTAGAFSVPGLSGVGSDIFICAPGSLGTTTSCTYTSYWIGASNGFTGEIVDGLYILK